MSLGKLGDLLPAFLRVGHLGFVSFSALVRDFFLKLEVALPLFLSKCTRLQSLKICWQNFLCKVTKPLLGYSRLAKMIEMENYIAKSYRRLF
jgi:hypothetical protein